MAGQALPDSCQAARSRRIAMHRKLSDSVPSFQKHESSANEVRHSTAANQQRYAAVVLQQHQLAGNSTTAVGIFVFLLKAGWRGKIGPAAVRGFSAARTAPVAAWLVARLGTTDSSTRQVCAAEISVPAGIAPLHKRSTARLMLNSSEESRVGPHKGKALAAAPNARPAEAWTCTCQDKETSQSQKKMDLQVRNTHHISQGLECLQACARAPQMVRLVYLEGAVSEQGCQNHHERQAENLWFLEIQWGKRCREKLKCLFDDTKCACRDQSRGRTVLMSFRSSGDQRPWLGVPCNMQANRISTKTNSIVGN